MDQKQFANIESRLNAIQQWQATHEVEDAANFTETRKMIASKPSTEELEAIIYKALVTFFTQKGILSKNVLVTAAVVIGSLAVIGGGFKWLLGVIGFSYLSR